MSDDFILGLVIYKNLAEHLMDYDDSYEVQNALIWRDQIMDELDSGVALTPEQEKELADADDKILAARQHIVQKFPEVFHWKEDVPKKQWWWHLPEGPEVREKARAA